MFFRPHGVLSVESWLKLGINICGSGLTVDLKSETQLCFSLSHYCLQLIRRPIWTTNCTKITTFCDVTECSSVKRHKYLAGTLLRHISALNEGAKVSDKSVVCTFVTEYQMFYFEHRGLMPNIEALCPTQRHYAQHRGIMPNIEALRPKQKPYAQHRGLMPNIEALCPT